MIHGRELGFYVIFSEAHKFKRLDHNVRIMITDSAGRKLDTVTNQVILIGRNRQRIDLPTLSSLQYSQSTRRHGEGIMAKLQLPRLFTHLIHWEINNPTKRILLTIHMPGDTCAERLNHDSRRFLCGLPLSRRKRNKSTRFESQRRNDSIPALSQKFRDTANQLTTVIKTEPIHLIAGLHLNICTDLINKFARFMKIGHDNSLNDTAFGKRGKVTSGNQIRDIRNRQINTQVWFV